jgi:hypothetical protein
MSEQLTVKQFQMELGFNRSSAYRILAHEPGVHRYFVPGSKKPIIRVDRAVVDRIKLRSTTRAS